MIELASEQPAYYHRHGFLVVPGLLTCDDVQAFVDHEASAASPEHRSWRKDYEMRRLTVPRGSGVFFTGMIVHGSYANKSATRDRLAFAVHYVSEGTWVYRSSRTRSPPAGGRNRRADRSQGISLQGSTRHELAVSMLRSDWCEY